MSIYVSRDVSNKKALDDWATSQGFTTTVDDYHITIAYSRTDINNYVPDDSSIVIYPSQFMELKPLGDEGAVVLACSVNELSLRWKDLIDDGATWDYPSYTPHISITYNKPEGMDLSSVVLPDFPIVLLGEKSEPLDLDKSKDYKDK